MAQCRPEYLDFVILAVDMSCVAVAGALAPLDRLHQQGTGQPPLPQMQVRLSHALPHGLEDTELGEVKTSLRAGTTGRPSRQLACDCNHRP